MGRFSHTRLAKLAASALVIAACAMPAQGQTPATPDSRPAAPESQPAMTPGDPAVYTPLFRYVPEKVEAMMILSAAGLPEQLKDFVHATGEFQKDARLKAVRVVCAGRKFNERQDSEGVSVYELEKPISLPDVVREDKYNYETIAGVPCFVKKPPEEDWQWGPLEDWIAVVDKKFLIFATRRAILKEALTAKGAGPEVRMEKLGWKTSEIAWGSPLLIARKPEPDKAKPQAPYEKLLLTWDVSKKKARIEAVGKDGAAILKHLRTMVGDRRGESRPARHADDEEEEVQNEWTGFGAIDPVSSSGDRHVYAVGVQNGEHDWFWNQTVYYLYNGAGGF